jgi:small subunit ribosomal protein S6
MEKERYPYMRHYEMVFIVQPDVDEEGLAAVRDKIGGFITSNGGQVGAVDLWGRRRLSYPIAHQREGQYVLMRFGMDPAHLPELERIMKLDSRVIRRLVMRSDEEA